MSIAIASFKDATTADIYHGSDSKHARKISRDLWPRIQRRLDALNAAIALSDFKGPGFQLEKLKGGLEGYWSIRVNEQYRICFQFDGGNAKNVFCADVH